MKRLTEHEQARSVPLHHARAPMGLAPTRDGNVETAENAQRTSNAPGTSHMDGAGRSSPAPTATAPPRRRVLPVNPHQHAGQFDRRRESRLPVVPSRRHPNIDRIETGG